ncbi:hypothetical protein ACB283_21395, partial [Aeromonas caviae]
AIGPLPTGVVEGRGQGVHREDRLSHPGRTDAVNPVLVNRYQVDIVKPSLNLIYIVSYIALRYMKQIRRYWLKSMYFVSFHSTQRHFLELL